MFWLQGGLSLGAPLQHKCAPVWNGRGDAPSLALASAFLGMGEGGGRPWGGKAPPRNRDQLKAQTEDASELRARPGRKGPALRPGGLPQQEVRAQTTSNDGEDAHEHSAPSLVPFFVGSFPLTLGICLMLTDVSGDLSVPLCNGQVEESSNCAVAPQL